MRFFFPTRPAASLSQATSFFPTPGVSSQGLPPLVHHGESEDLRELIQRRLRYAYMIGSFLVITYLAYEVQAVRLGRLLGVFILIPLLLGPAVILWTRPRISLPMLRVLDVIFLLLGFLIGFNNCLLRINGSAVLDQATAPLTQLIKDPSIWYFFPDSAVISHRSGSILSNTIIINWGFLAVGYSVLIPNTWRRAAIIMSLIVLSSLSCIVYATIRIPPFHNNLVSSLFYTGTAVGAFSAIGLYGAHKLHVLRKEAYHARQLGQYTLKELLGKGGMGEVYLAQHRVLRRPCAVKLIRPELDGADDKLLRFEREVQAMARLTHPNTVEIYDYGRGEDGTFFYVMEYLPGMSLEDLVDQHGPLPPGRAIYLLRQVCGALREAHAQGLIHRDIKPANLFVCERGGLCDVIKVLDFGLVRDVHLSELPAPTALASQDGTDTLSSGPKLTQVGHLLGSPAYMSPEQICAEEVDARSDIYGLGGVLCYLLTGKPAFEATRVEELCAAHISEPAPLLRQRNPEIPAELEAIVTRCLSKRPAARFQSAQELDAALGACASAATWDREQATVWWMFKPVSQPNSRVFASAETSAGD